MSPESLQFILNSKLIVLKMAAHVLAGSGVDAIGVLEVSRFSSTDAEGRTVELDVALET